MDSFYGGKQGRTYHIVKRYGSVQEMLDLFFQGGKCTVGYGLYVIIDTLDKSDLENGLLFRRGFDYNEKVSTKPNKEDKEEDGQTYKYYYDDNENQVYHIFNTLKWQTAIFNWFQQVGRGAIYIGQIVGPAGQPPEIIIPIEGTPHNQWSDMTYSKGSTWMHEGSSDKNIYAGTKAIKDEHGNTTKAELYFDFPAPSFSVGMAQQGSDIGVYGTTINNNLFYHQLDFAIPYIDTIGTTSTNELPHGHLVDIWQALGHYGDLYKLLSNNNNPNPNAYAVCIAEGTNDPNAPVIESFEFLGDIYQNEGVSIWQYIIIPPKENEDLLINYTYNKESTRLENVFRTIDYTYVTANGRLHIVYNTGLDVAVTIIKQIDNVIFHNENIDATQELEFIYNTGLHTYTNPINVITDIQVYGDRFYALESDPTSDSRENGVAIGSDLKWKPLGSAIAGYHFYGDIQDIDDLTEDGTAQIDGHYIKDGLPSEYNGWLVTVQVGNNSEVYAFDSGASDYSSHTVNDKPSKWYKVMTLSPTTEIVYFHGSTPDAGFSNLGDGGCWFVLSDGHHVN